MLFRVSDTVATSARVVGYEQMTDIDTGSGEFPTSAQMSGGGYICKSVAADANPVKWYLIADGRSIILSVAGYSSQLASAHGAQNRFIGDFLATRPGGDPYAFVLGYGANGGHGDGAGLYDGAGGSYATPRAYTGLGSCVLHVTYAYSGNAGVTSGTDGLFGAFPSAIDGGLRLSKRYVATALSDPIRGDLPGVYTVPQSGLGASYSSGAVLAGTGVLAGRKLLALSCGSFSTPVPNPLGGVSFVDITGPWR